MSAKVALPQGHGGPYHFGEEAVQQRIGVRETSLKVGRTIRDYMDKQHQQFFSELSLLHTGIRNTDGSVWATTLAGQPGFMKVIDDRHLSITLKQIYGDPAKFAEGLAVGSVGVMLHNRRRNKLNSIVESVQPGRLTLRVVQAIGNCPKYIQIRHVVIDQKLLATLGSEERAVTSGGPVLGREEKAFIARSDTMFLATSFVGGSNSNLPSSCDCNHRGGSPGFVKVVGGDPGDSLLLPDFLGNNMFQSLGNITANPTAGMQFLDFATGDSLQLTGHAEILFDERSLPGAQRTIKLIVSKWVHVKSALPISTEGAVELSPYNPLSEADGKAFQGLKCNDRWSETHDIMTFEFVAPISASRKPFCEAGQFASFDFPDGEGTTLNRTWTISNSPREIARTGKFTISVKKAGRVSGYLHENLTPGREVLFRGVDGDFTLDKAVRCIPPAGVLLIAGGIGVTPMRVMFTECLQRGYPTVFIYTAREERDLAFLEEFREGSRTRDNVRLAVTITKPTPGQMLAGIETFHGRLSSDIIKQVCPDCVHREAFQCGPVPMMSAAKSALESLGMSAANIHQENFNF